jgi:hypothetical protein
MRTFTGGLVAVLMVAGSAAAQAQEGQNVRPPEAQVPSATAPKPTTPAEAEAEAHRAHVQLTLRGQHTFEADLKDSTGSVAIDRAGVGASLRLPIGDRSRLSATLNTEYSAYDFNNATGFAPGFTKPWDDTIEVNGSATFSTQATRQWGWYVGAGIDDSAEIGAEYGKGITGGVYGGVSYGISEKLSVGLGLLLRTRLEDNGEVLPLPYINWQISDKWSLGTRSTVTGTGVTLSYQPIEQLTLSLDGAYETREYRLDDSAAAPEGVARDQRFPIAIGAQWNFTRMIAVSARMGMDFFQEYTLVDSNSNDVAKIKTDPAFFLGASVVFSF